MKKEGFTLVELLAVIAILAVIVIIALPNVMEMFTGAKESTFITEVKKIYRGAEEQYIKDAFNGSGTRIYSKCSNGCANELDMDVRGDLDYYIQINSSGKVVKFYATDKSFQYGHDGEMNINDIKNVEVISELSDNQKLSIDNEGPFYGTDFSCKYKFITDRGSFSTTEDVKEICANVVNDGYTYQNQDTGWYQTYNDRYKYLSLLIDVNNINQNTSVKVYEDSTKSHLLGEINSSDLPQNRISINNMYEYSGIRNVVKILGEYRKENVYVEASAGQTYALTYTYEDADAANKIYTGPWITDSDTIEKINNLKQSLSGTNYYINGMSNCDSSSGECTPNIYHMTLVYNNASEK